MNYFSSLRGKTMSVSVSGNPLRSRKMIGWFKPGVLNYFYVHISVNSIPRDQAIETGQNDSSKLQIKFPMVLTLPFPRYMAFILIWNTWSSSERPILVFEVNFLLTGEVLMFFLKRMTVAYPFPSQIVHIWYKLHAGFSTSTKITLYFVDISKEGRQACHWKD